MLKDRCCEVCSAPADLSKTSASFGRVHFFCTEHGSAFNEGSWAVGSTREVFARIDLWMKVKREAMGPQLEAR